MIEPQRKARASPRTASALASLGPYLWSACSVGVPAPSRTPGAVPTTVALSHYDVTGSTADELLVAMLAQGPRVGGLPVFAANEWQVRWRLRPVRRAGQCEIAHVDVTLHMTTVLPRWKTTAAANTRLAEDWRAFLDAVDQHELGHRALGERAARAVLERVSRLRRMRAESCDELLAEAHSAAQSTLAEYHERNLQYDVDTAHGSAQGVRWPPPRSPVVK